jgi:hypothetical protein
MVVWNSHVAANYYHQLGRWWRNMLVSYVFHFKLTVHNLRTKLHHFFKGHRRMELACKHQLGRKPRLSCSFHMFFIVNSKIKKKGRAKRSVLVPYFKSNR